MATFPHSLCGIRQDGHGEQHMPMVLRSDMERGIPKQRRAGADVLVRVPCSLVFRSAADAAAFEAWFYADGMGWFDFNLPRTGAVVQARIIGGDIGTLSPLTPAWNASERSVVLEYVRPAFVTLAPGLYDVDSSRILSVQRNSTATYIDSSGVLQTAQANTARYQGGQLLVEGEGTNLLLSSGAFSGASRAKIDLSVVDGAVAGIGGAGVASLITVAGDDPNIYEFVDVSGGQTYTFSFWVKGFGPAAGKVAGFLPWFIGTATGDNVFQNFVLPAELTRLCFQFTPNTSGSMVVRLDLPQNPGSSVGDEIGMTGWQLEAGAAATSYIPTTTAPATRAADIITVAA